MAPNPKTTDVSFFSMHPELLDAWKELSDLRDAQREVDEMDQEMVIRIKEAETKYYQVLRQVW